ncbi:30S ribosomal protein S6 [Croceibacter atlanticus HTCC2559]|uniref:30S ribosomal protein S6 n=1 Tax=Croceibacter atlanticus (strain ATCC BAA-628 / JCM 21780 / CIP 108009 / IAM 15332 / KCTC 12090 / HTCC2559) TaxID=216432 RepID=A3U967_CROAH|nr:30S ribosomal protein S6 [Croceibacter atlanticus HTCC2559]
MIHTIELFKLKLRAKIRIKYIFTTIKTGLFLVFYSDKINITNDQRFKLLADCLKMR